ncbi:MAG: hypothetical protein J6S01_05600 [Bacteroidales bacterium]|nr:hypothetical protein [Bacteroidales bacterium]
MRRFLTLIAAVVLGAMTLSAQTNLSYKEWSDGPLTSDDFSKRRGAEDIVGQVYTGIEVNAGDWEKINWNTRVKRVKSKAIFDPIRSWIRTDTLTDQGLRYGQLIFDATEVTRRQMQNHLTGDEYSADYISVIKRYGDIVEARTDEIERMTEHGTNLKELEVEEKVVAKELAEISEAEFSIPDYKLRKFAMGMYGGVATQIHPGKYASYFTPSVGFDWGFDIGIGRSEIQWDLLMGGGSKLLQDIPGDDIGTWKAGRRLFGGEITLLYAYNVYDGDVFKISPFAGFGVGFIDYNNPDRNAEILSDEISGPRWVGGLSVEFKYLRSLYLVGDMMWSSIYGGLNEHSLRLKVYLAHTTYSNGMNPYSLNISLCCNILSKYMKP